LLHLDVISISAVAFQCNNNRREASPAILLPQKSTKLNKDAQKAK
jgi:hypothetical protein